MKIDIELQALVTEREGMVSANMERQHRGEGLAYPESCFTQLAAEIRALNAAELAATAANSDYAAAQRAWKLYVTTFPQGTSMGFIEFCEERLHSEEPNVA